MVTRINKLMYFLILLFCFSLVLLLLNISLNPSLKVVPKQRTNFESFTTEELFEHDTNWITNAEYPDFSEQSEDDSSSDDRMLTDDTLDKLKLLLNCYDENPVAKFRQRGDYWTMTNVMSTDQLAVHCHESVTLTTHGTYNVLDNILPLIQRWKNPISVAVFAPGDDFTPVINTIDYLRECSGNELVKKYVSFHLFFPFDHMALVTPWSMEPYNCSLPPPYESTDTYREKKKLNYPINVARNIAIEAARTHFIMASDIELYPSPYLPERFLNLIARNDSFSDSGPRVFPLNIFEVEADQRVPKTKTDLVNMIRNKKAVQFHKKFCSFCHQSPMIDDWLASEETEFLQVFGPIKRNGSFVNWEPIFIGTKKDPIFEERIFWEGRKDRMTQAYIMCIQMYDYFILNDAFLVHKPGIKIAPTPGPIFDSTIKMIKNTILPELKILYGEETSCEG